MRLHNVKLQGFRRFEIEQSLNVSSKLTAIVGPNEAGKTSLLRAIEYLADDRAIAERDRTSLSQTEVKLTLSFFLNADDLSVAGLKKASWLDLIKRGDGQIKYDIRPRPDRDLAKRGRVASILKRVMSTKRLMAEWDGIPELGSATLERSVRLLESATAYDSDQRTRLTDLHAALTEASSEKFSDRLEELSSAVGELIEFEGKHNPFQTAINSLADRVPAILNFTQEFRDIVLPYNVTLYNHSDINTRQNPSRPLAELIRLSELDLDILKGAISSGNKAIKAGIISASNDKLAELTSLIWKQSDATLYFDMDGPNLTVLVKNVKGFETKDQFTEFELRSDGYRQFVALQIFTFLQKAAGSILLIDEIETHLHYDAQADLIQILQNEPTIGSVIYTTHSAGALPEDLGLGIRMIGWDQDRRKSSNIINKFWRDDSVSGFKPLLFGMGATTLAFFPTRRALIGEGPTELLLLPTFLREALDRPSLDFQVVHGLSNMNPKGLPMLDHDGSRVCYFTDSDKAGEGLKSALQKAGVPAEQVFSVSDISAGLVTIEDLLDGGAWLEAVNRYIDMYGKDRGVNARLAQAPPIGRVRALPASIRSEKIAFSYNILDLIRDTPDLRILDPKYVPGLSAVGKLVRAQLELTD